jgi:hypothetical protein
MYGRGVPKWFESPIQPAITSQLRGLGSTNQLNVDMPNGTTEMFYSITQDLGTALGQGGRPWREFTISGNLQRHYYTVTTFMGGFLLDGCPLNVIFGQGWIAGQQDALNAAGIVPHCPELTTVPGQSMTPTVPILTTATGPIPSQTFQPPQAAVFTPTLTSGGIVTAPSPAAPNTTVYSAQTPPPVTGFDVEPGGIAAGLHDGSTGPTEGLGPIWPYLLGGYILYTIVKKRK